MPFYDFRCNNCEKEFNVLAQLREMEEKKIPCPGCGSRDLTRVWRQANIGVVSRAAVPEPPNACACCRKDCPHAGR